MGLPKGNRLKRRQDFQQLYRQGIPYKSPHLILRALPISRKPDTASPVPTKIGIAVSQKVSKKAVVRNRIKRQIRAAIGTLLPSLSPGWKVAIAVRPQAVECKYEHFLRELKQLLKQAELSHGN